MLAKPAELIFLLYQADQVQLTAQTHLLFQIQLLLELSIPVSTMCSMSSWKDQIALLHLREVRVQSLIHSHLTDIYEQMPFRPAPVPVAGQLAAPAPLMLLELLLPLQVLLFHRWEIGASTMRAISLEMLVSILPLLKKKMASFIPIKWLSQSMLTGRLQFKSRTPT